MKILWDMSQHGSQSAKRILLCLKCLSEVSLNPSSHHPCLFVLLSVRLKDTPWIHAVAAIAPEAMLEPPSGELANRRRPLIYVYDIPAEYTSKMLQFRYDIKIFGND